MLCLRGIVKGRGRKGKSIHPTLLSPPPAPFTPNSKNKGTDIPHVSTSISVIGLSDGLTVPFALTAGLSSLGESRLVILGGIAELIAGAISMGIGGFLASQAERDHYRYLRRTTQARVKRSCDGEVEREVHAVLGPVGLDQNVSRRVAHSLLEVESGVDQGNGQGNGHSATDAEHGLRWSQSVGVTEFLLKFGEGLGTRPITWSSTSFF